MRRLNASRRMAAEFSGAFPVRARLSSSLSRPSNTQCSLFSIPVGPEFLLAQSCCNCRLVPQRNQWNVSAPRRESVPRASGPARGTESQCFSCDGRQALEKFNTHRLEWLVRTLDLPVPGFAFRDLRSFLLFVPLPLFSRKNRS